MMNKNILFIILSIGLFYACDKNTEEPITKDPVNENPGNNSGGTNTGGNNGGNTGNNSGGNSNGELKGPKDDVFRYLFTSESLENQGSVSGNHFARGDKSGLFVSDRYNKAKSAFEVKGENLMGGVIKGEITNLTLSFWMKTTKDNSSSKRGIIGITATDRNGIRVFQKGDKLGWYMTNSSGKKTVDANTNVFNNKWNNVLVTLKTEGYSCIVSVFVNGSKVGGLSTSVGSAGYIADNPKVQIGELFQSLFNGSVDDIRVYKRVVTAAEIKELSSK